MAITSKLSLVVVLIASLLSSCGLAFGDAPVPETTVVEGSGSTPGELGGPAPEGSNPPVTVPLPTTTSTTTSPLKASDLPDLVPDGQSRLCAAADAMAVASTQLTNVGSADTATWPEVLTDAQQAEGVRLLGEFRARLGVLLQEMEAANLLSDPARLHTVIERIDGIDQTEDIRYGFLIFVSQYEAEFTPLTEALVVACPGSLLTDLLRMTE